MDQKMTECQQEVQLVEEETQQFRGATLSLVDDKPTDRDCDSGDDRRCVVVNRPSASSQTIGQSPVIDQNQDIHRHISEDFFATREGVLENAAESCRPIVLANLDGELRGVWLLTEIDHWDTEKERMIFLCDDSLIIIKYDFITLKLMEYKRLSLKKFDRIEIGQINYPEGSLIPNQIGIRCTWNFAQEIPFFLKWNPWAKTYPMVTLTSHPLLTERQRIVIDNPSLYASFDVDDFAKSLVQTMIELRAKDPNVRTQIHHQPVVIENYVNLISAVHNATDLGFFKARGKLSF